MQFDWLKGIRSALFMPSRGRKVRRASTPKELRTAVIEILEPRVLLSADVGDTFDPGPGLGEEDALKLDSLSGQSSLATEALMGEIHGTVWDDVDGDGIRDAGEDGLSGRTVYLDQNNNRHLDIGGALEPDSYTNGTVLNTIVPGVTLTAVGINASSPNVTATTASPTSTGTLAFAHSGNVVWTDVTQRLRIDFNQPTNRVSIDFTSDDSVDIGRLQVYDAQGNILGEAITAGLASSVSETMTVSRAAPDIAYAIAGGFDGQAGRLDNLTFGDSEVSTTTDSNGDYSFTGLAAGNYTVRLAQESGRFQTAPEPPPSSIVITEVDLSTPDWVEIQNVSSAAVDTSGWQVVVSESPYTDINTVNAVTWVLPSSMAADEVLYRTDDGGDSYWGSNLFWNPGNTGWVMILDDVGNIVDWVGWGWSDAELASFNVSLGSFTIPSLGDAWAGPAIGSVDTTGTGFGTIQRIGSADTNGSSDFIWSSPGSKGSQNSGLSTPQDSESGDAVVGSPADEVEIALAELAPPIDLSWADPDAPIADRLYSATEIVALIAGPDPLELLATGVEAVGAGLDGLLSMTSSRELFELENRGTLMVLGLEDGVDPLEMVERLSPLTFIEWAAPNYVYLDFDPRELIPNDTDYPQQYHHPLMQNELAWNVTLGSSSVIVGVADDGVDFDHIDLVTNIWTNPGEIPGNGIDDDNNGYIDDVNGWDFIDDDNNPDHNGSDSHGTHVSGIAAGRTNNGTGIAGTAGGATIMPLKFYDGSNPSAWTSLVIAETYAYAIDNGAQIVNTSYNVNGFVGDPTFAAGLQYFYDQGGLHLNSAGNATELNPARQVFDQSLFVSSTTSTDTLSPFSNYGFGIDVAAPGSSILSTLPGDTYGLASGTSMSTPNAAGVAALIWSANPTWTRDQVAAQLVGVTDDIDSLNPGFEDLLGSGRVNSFRALTETLAPPTIERVVGLPADGDSTSSLVVSFAVDVANVFDPATVHNGANWLLRGAGDDGLFDTADDVLVSLTSPTTYMIGTNRIVFNAGAPLAPDDYRLTAVSGGLADPFGTALDGDGDGTAGDDFVHFFSVEEVNDAGHPVALTEDQIQQDIDFGSQLLAVETAPNIEVTSASLVNSLGDPIAAPVIGQRYGVRVDYTTTDLPIDAEYRIDFAVDGVVLDTGTVTSGAGLSSGSWFYYRTGWYAASGLHTVEVIVDATDTVAETSEADNSGSFDFTAVTATPPGQLVSPIEGIPFADWTISNYVDIDPTSGLSDYNGGIATYDGHNAVDFVIPNFAAMDTGVSVFAALDGTVTEVHDGEFDRQTDGFSISPTPVANYVRIDHANGWETIYWHLRRDSIVVEEGEQVTAGQTLGLVGSSGISTSPHLHFGVKYDGGSVATYLDPTTYWQTPLRYVGDETTIIDAGVTNYVPSDHLKERPSNVDVFDQSTGQTTYAWIRASGLTQGDSLVFEWRRPDSSLYSTSTIAISQDYSSSYWYSGKNLPTVPDLGEWTVEIKVNGANIGETTFDVQSVGAPEIRVERVSDAAIILDGRTTPIDFGTADPLTPPVSQTFEVINHGSNDLTISSVVVPTGFLLVEGIDALIAAGQSDTFTLQLDPNVDGSHSDQFTFITNDSDESSFNFAVEGTTVVNLAFDFGDAPDVGAGTSTGNYNTLTADNGPSHAIVSGLFMGVGVDDEADGLPNAAANGDDTDQALPDDEDGLNHPAADLLLTVGAQPTINVIVSNTTGSAATLYGWIDYNGDGVFDNGTERASVAVPDTTDGGIVTLVFPTVPAGFTGTTYARFRLSTDAAAADPTGAASDGEVEDYRATIMLPDDGTAGSTVKIVSGINGGPTFQSSNFGSAVASLGDVNGDGIPDLAVGARLDDAGGTDKGALYILYMNADGTVGGSTKIAENTGGGPSLDINDRFGSSVAVVGDLDGDGIDDLAVGAELEGSLGVRGGSVYILFMNADGTAKSFTKIAHQTGGGPTLAEFDKFGTSLASLGDLDGDGIGDLVVGAAYDNTGGSSRGAVYVLFMNSDGTARETAKIASNTTGGPTFVSFARFGWSVASPGDLDGDGISDLAAGAPSDESTRGSVLVLLMNADGTVKSISKIASGIGGGPILAGGDQFGASIGAIGDLDGDGIGDLAVGARSDATGGATYILFMNADGTAKGSTRIASGIGGGPLLLPDDFFGSAVTSLGDLDGDGLNELAVGARYDSTGGQYHGAVYVLFMDAGRDYGDAPDTSPGTSPGNYNTLALDDGAIHQIVAGLFMGAGVDGDPDALPNSAANGDDVHQALPDDEDGLPNVAADLTLTVGAQPTVDVLVTNTSGATATLYGWIDYNGNGVFDNATERTSVTVPDATIGELVTLIFPTVPVGFTGTTYARFRLSTQAEAADPTGFAADGEVEDHAATITLPSDGTVAGSTKVAHQTAGGPTLVNNDRFGISVASLGDLNGDGIGDMAVGARYDDTGGTDRGAVYVQFMNADGSVASSTKIASGLSGAPTLVDGDQFGISVASLDDINGDGVVDLVVGAFGDDTGGTFRGAVHVLFMNTDGTVASSTKIASETGGGPTLPNISLFGTSVASLGDLDGDGISDMAVGAVFDATGGSQRGAVYVLLMNADGTAKASTKIASATGGGPTLTNGVRFGRSIASLGDLDGDGVADMVVGAYLDDTGGGDRGAVHVLFLNSDGTAKGTAKIASGTVGAPALADGDRFGSSVASVGDLNGDGVGDLTVGARHDGTGGTYRGAVHVLFMNVDGTVASTAKIADGTGGGPTLANSDAFGSSVASLGDLDGDGVIELAVGARGDSTGGTYRGAVHVLFMNSSLELLDYGDAPDTGPGNSNGNYNTLASDSGPSHVLTADLFIGANFDGEADALPNSLALGDDVNQALPDDEDGLNNAAIDLVLTAGTQPTVNVVVTNKTGSAATLYGWIDYNADGVFDNATERTSVAVPDATIGETFTLVFPTVLSGFNGTTYARFRLSTDAAAADPTGAASDGEVEDYAATIANPHGGVAGDITKIASDTNGGPTLVDSDYFGNAVVSLGDLDGDGVEDLAAGRFFDDTEGIAVGSIHVLFMNADGTVDNTTKIGNGLGGGPTLPAGSFFGSSLASLGDLDGDGVVDLAVGALGDSTGGHLSGAVYVVFMNADGTAKSTTRIASDVGGGPTLSANTLFGSSVASLGDLDGDGISDLAVGAIFDDAEGTDRGSVHVLFLNPDGTAKSTTRIASGVSGGPVLADYDAFGGSVASLGDLDGDGISDLAVGAAYDSADGYQRGAVYVLFMNADGTVGGTTRIASGVGGGPTLADGDLFGSSLASIGDVDGDGVADLAAGAITDDTGGTGRGAVHLLLLNADGTVKSSTKIGHQLGGGPTLVDGDQFGHSVAALGDLDGDGRRDLAVGATFDDTGGTDRGALYVLFMDSAVPSFDYGDAPDTGAGTGAGNYNTHAVDGGPSHQIAVGLFMGASVDGENDAFPNVVANGDDVNQALPDDEDGLNYPTADLLLTVGAQPTVNVIVSNTSGSAATLYGWIDYNGDGVFDNATERTLVAVPDTTDGGIVTLVFPTVPAGFTGTTYARFRLSTDVAAADPTGAVSDGEVEDYRATIMLPDDGTAGSTLKIASGINGGPIFQNSRFGSAVTSLGDVNGDGIPDLAVGAKFDDTGTTDQGALYILFMNADGTVGSTTKIADNTGGGPDLSINERFGSSVAVVGDLDGDGINDLAVGAELGESSGVKGGGVYILFMNADGTAKSVTKIAHQTGGGPTLAEFDKFGTSLTSLGDLDGDGIGDLAVGAAYDNTGGSARGAVYVLFMNSDGTARATTKIAEGTGGGPTFPSFARFGWSVASPGDLDGDGISDLAAGAPSDDSTRGSVLVLFMNADGTVKSTTKITSDTNGGPTLAGGDWFGGSLGAIGDLDGDGINDLAAGARSDATGGAMYILFMNADGTAKGTTKIASGIGGGPAFVADDFFGSAVASAGDLDGDGVNELVIGSSYDDTGQTSRGSLYVLFMDESTGPGADIVARDAANGQWRVALSTGTSFDTQIWGGWNPANTYVDVFLTDVDGDGLDDLIGRNDANGQWLVSLSTGTSFAAPQVWASWNPSRDIIDVQAADFNNDGLTDIAGRDAANGQWRVNLSTGTAFGPTEFWTTWNPNRTIINVLSADFNNDGRADIAGRDANSGQWRVNLSTGTTFGPTEFWTDWNPSRDIIDVFSADFNGDGQSDIAGRDSATGVWRVNLSTGTGFTTTEFWTDWNPTRDIIDVLSADFNNDGMADIAGRDSVTGVWRVNLSTGSSFTTTEFWTDWNPNRDIVDVQSADFNGDGRADIAGRDSVTGVWRVNLSTGSSFTTTEFWGSWNPTRTYVDVLAGNVDSVGSPGDSVIEGTFLAESSPSGDSEQLDGTFADLAVPTATVPKPESPPSITAAADTQAPSLPLENDERKGLLVISAPRAEVASLPSRSTSASAPLVQTEGRNNKGTLPDIDAGKTESDDADTDEFFALVAGPENANPLVGAEL